MNIKRKVTATYFSCFIRNTKEGEYIPAGGKLNRWVELSSVEATEGYRVQVPYSKLSSIRLRVFGFGLC